MNILYYLYQYSGDSPGRICVDIFLYITPTSRVSCWHIPRPHFLFIFEELKHLPWRSTSMNKLQRQKWVSDFQDGISRDEVENTPEERGHLFIRWRNRGRPKDSPWRDKTNEFSPFHKVLFIGNYSQVRTWDAGCGGGEWHSPSLLMRINGRGEHECCSITTMILSLTVSVCWL